MAGNTPLQHRIKVRMQEKNLTISALEKRAHLNSSALRNIMLGRSKRPSAETLQAVAVALDCSVEFLLTGASPTATKKSNAVEQAAQHAWNKELFLVTVNYVDSYSKQKNLALTFEQALPLIKEIYIYSLDKGEPHLDRKFAEWLLNQHL